MKAKAGDGTTSLPTNEPQSFCRKFNGARFIAPVNPLLRYQSSSLLGLYDVPIEQIELFAGLLNSSVVVLARMLFARGLGNAGNSQLDVYSAKMMLVPDVSRKTPAAAKIVAAFRKLAARDALSFIPERRMRQMAYTRAEPRRRTQETLERERA